jgi:hypothetical protein
MSPEAFGLQGLTVLGAMKILAFDLDKTALNEQTLFSPQDTLTLQAVARAGHLVVPASGRMTDSIRPFSRLLGLDTPIIAYNGAMVRDTERRGHAVLCHEPLDPRHGDWLIDFCARRHLHLNYYLDDRLYARADADLRPFSGLYTRQTGSEFHFVPDLSCFRGRRPTKAIIVTAPVQRDALFTELRDGIGREINLVKTNPEYLEFMSPLADKGRGLDALARHYGVARTDILAFGDGHNDVQMLKYAGVGVAVANASAEVKAVAARITRATHNQSPITEVCQELGLVP